MTWDFVEINPFSKKMGSWAAMLQGVAKGIEVLPSSLCGHVEQRDASARIEETGKCVISTDPPYYDNIGYADLSDFFYVWMRRNLREIWPDECATLLTPKVEELIADSYRTGSKEAANRHFELGMEGVFSKAALNCDERYPATVFYAFKATESEVKGNVSTGWETFLSGLLNAGFSITATWPVRTEFANKIGISGGDNMLASSIVLACRKRVGAAAIATRGEFVSALRSEMAPAIKILQVENIAPVDMAQSAIGPGIGIFSRYSKVIEADGQPMTVRTALALINEVLAEVLSGEESEFDADTRFAVTWFEQFGHNPGLFGDADTLAKAKNTTVNGVVESGVAVVKDGKLRLLERNEMSDNWDPIMDKRLTVWETTQYLIRALEDSESKAAELVARLGPGVSERARQLAYLLYGICDRKKWANEGSSYNMLVTAWPEIEKLARQTSSGNTTTETLF
jgi:putative DNA methylase